MNMQPNNKRYHGYLILSRHTKFLMEDLGYPLYGFYLGLIQEARWDRRYLDTFGRVHKTNVELAQVFGCNQSTISRNLTKLQKKRYVVKHHRYVTLLYFPLFK